MSEETKTVDQQIDELIDQAVNEIKPTETQADEPEVEEVSGAADKTDDTEKKDVETSKTEATQVHDLQERLDAMQRDNEELRLRVEESEEILANPQEYFKIPEKQPEPKEEEIPDAVDYDELIDTPKKLAEVITKDVLKETQRIIDERDAPRLKAEREAKERERAVYLENLNNQAREMVADCRKNLEDWEKYEPEIRRQSETFEKKHGLQAIIDGDILRGIYARLRIEEAKKKLDKQTAGTKSEKPGQSTTGAKRSGPMTTEVALEEAVKGLTPEERRVLRI